MFSEGTTKIPSPLFEDYEVAFSFEQISGENVEINNNKLVNTSMTINGELAPAFDITEAEIISTGATLNLKIVANCNEMPLDEDGKCAGLSIDKLLVGIKEYNNEEVTRSLLDSSFSLKVTFERYQFFIYSNIYCSVWV